MFRTAEKRANRLDPVVGWNPCTGLALAVDDRACRLSAAYCNVIEITA
jgi:hypothetical protein